MKIGLKLWSTNDNYVTSAQKLYSDGFFDFIELYVVPGSFVKFKDIWKNFEIPYTLHTPHTIHGFNLALEDSADSNRKLFSEVEKYSDYLDASSIIIHPGIEGELTSTLNQLSKFRDTIGPPTYSKLVLENKPYISLVNTNCRGALLEEVNVILSKTGLKFCLDIGHAIKTALFLKTDPLDYLDRFFKLKPLMVHLSDGNLDNYYDQHLSLGAGEFDLSKILSKIKQNKVSLLILETSKKSQDNLDDYTFDVKYIRKSLENVK